MKLDIPDRFGKKFGGRLPTAILVQHLIDVARSRSGLGLVPWTTRHMVRL